MRAYPFGFVFSQDIQKAKTWAAAHSTITHGDYSAQASCAALAVGIAYALQQKDYTFIIEEMIKAAQEYDQTTADKMTIAYHAGLQAKKLLNHNQDCITQLKNPHNTFRQWHEEFFKKYQGWSAQDAIAGVVYIFSCVPNDIKTAIYLGVHTPGDSDSIASLAGALVGAYTQEFNIADLLLERLENYDYLCALADAIK